MFNNFIKNLYVEEEETNLFQGAMANKAIFVFTITKIEYTFLSTAKLQLLTSISFK